MKLDRRTFLGLGGAAMVAGVAVTLPGREGEPAPSPAASPTG